MKACEYKAYKSIRKELLRIKKIAKIGDILPKLLEMTPKRI